MPDAPDITALFEEQRRFFRTHATLDLGFRRRALRALRRVLIEREGELTDALRADLGKGAAESYMSELGMVLAGLRDTLGHLGRWARPRRVASPLAQFPSTCRVLREPYGNALVISPWNYPVLLGLDPLVAAIAAGNCAILKPSELAPHVSAALAKLVGGLFPRKFVAVAEGGVETSEALLALPFDTIFFTGSPRVGRVVMEAAAKHLTPVTLELGGKSPCIVDETADIELAARRIAFGKVLNAGQTCVAPDYVLIAAARRDAFVEAYRRAVEGMVGANPLANEAMPRMVNRRHFDRVMGLMEGARAAVGGRGDAETLRIEPTLLLGVTAESPCMQEEIFGPVLPVLTVESLATAEEFVLSRPKPLACYVFSGSARNIERLQAHLSYGGGCVNDTIIHLAVPGLPFGGVGNSGMGAYHGQAGFLAFSHEKSVLRKATWLDLPFRYQPYTKFKDFVLRMFLR